MTEPEPLGDVFHIESMGPVERAYAEAMHEDCTDGPEHPLSAHSPWSGSDLDGVESWSEFTAKLARHGLTITFNAARTAGDVPMTEPEPLADLLDEHWLEVYPQASPPVALCSCGEWRLGVEGPKPYLGQRFAPFSRHVAEVILAARVAAPSDDWTDLANDIRIVDGNHDLGAGELAARLAERGWVRVAAPSDGLTENCRTCDLTYPAGTDHRCTDGWAAAQERLAGPFLDPATTEQPETDR